jgi:hypothetical protein
MYVTYQIQNVKRMDSFNLSKANLLDSYNQNISPEVSFKLL